MKKPCLGSPYFHLGLDASSAGRCELDGDRRVANAARGYLCGCASLALQIRYGYIRYGLGRARLRQGVGLGVLLQHQLVGRDNLLGNEGVGGGLGSPRIIIAVRIAAQSLDQADVGGSNQQENHTGQIHLLRLIDEV